MSDRVTVAATCPHTCSLKINEDGFAVSIACAGTQDVVWFQVPVRQSVMVQFGSSLEQGHQILQPVVLAEAMAVGPV